MHQEITNTEHQRLIQQRIARIGLSVFDTFNLPALQQTDLVRKFCLASLDFFLIVKILSFNLPATSANRS